MNRKKALVGVVVLVAVVLIIIGIDYLGKPEWVNGPQVPGFGGLDQVENWAWTYGKRAGASAKHLQGDVCHLDFEREKDKRFVFTIYLFDYEYARLERRPANTILLQNQNVRLGEATLRRGEYQKGFLALEVTDDGEPRWEVVNDTQLSDNIIILCVTDTFVTNGLAEIPPEGKETYAQNWAIIFARLSR